MAIAGRSQQELFRNRSRDWEPERASPYALEHEFPIYKSISSDSKDLSKMDQPAHSARHPATPETRKEHRTDVMMACAPIRMPSFEDFGKALES